jgi:hypothetical protein
MYREREERSYREYEQEQHWNEMYSKNKEKLEKAFQDGLPIIPYSGYPECMNCTKKDEDTRTGKEDDFCNIICLDPKCPCHEKAEDSQAGSAENENSDNESGDDYCLQLKEIALLDTLTVENVKSFAKLNYQKGGDCIIECMEDKEIQVLIESRGKDGVIDEMQTWYYEVLDVRNTIW